jgi:hypothetical protein
MDFTTAIYINNVIVSTNLQGVFRATPIKHLEKQGLDYSHVPRRTFGTRVVDDAMIYSLLNGEISFDEALARGTHF